jgi:hypothetical protein
MSAASVNVLIIAARIKFPCFTFLAVKLNGTHQLLAYAEDVNLLGDNIDIIKKNMDTLIDASKAVGLEINVEKTKYMLLSHHQNVGRNWNIFGNESNKSKF